ncbi:hypothetical protein EXIGLDRAFT_842988 [Exidia glandulosa HHB12029]|uniref:Uncharacterized protein n=1 Tax=Exidia glandulosa HHB12029 TaxID=1314781 RepID=A0A165CXY7_EXIGL|nr:hypothetical protein EXIGLDRAFT_842988 [Exidia glandulosa HHB12029]
MASAFAASVASQVAEAGGETLTHRLLETAQLVSNTADTMQVNRETAIALSRRIGELLVVVTTEFDLPSSTDEDSKWLQIRDEFEVVLREALQLLQDQQRLSYLSQLVYKDRNARAISDVTQHVTAMMDMFKLSAATELHRAASRAVVTAQERASVPLLENTARVTPSCARLPPCPQLYFGRTRETEAILNAISSNESSHIAILGAPGIGKTSIAIGSRERSSAKYRVEPFVQGA